ncbi:MAG: type II toxin-antitoxin system HicA family toxin [Deltaproteobacteria bacterium]|nr:type II toxin-antitoxin system HicA family toxin [Deltaproteobacteria bacterium]
MSKLPSLSTREVVSALRSAGFEDAPIGGRGSHHALARTDDQGRVRLVIVPERKDIPAGTLMAILKQAGLGREEFLA